MTNNLPTTEARDFHVLLAKTVKVFFLKNRNKKIQTRSMMLYFTRHEVESQSHTSECLSLPPALFTTISLPVYPPV